MALYLELKLSQFLTLNTESVLSGVKIILWWPSVMEKIRRSDQSKVRLLQDAILPCRTVELGFCVSWISVRLDSMPGFVGLTKTFIRKLLYFPGICICTSCPFLSLCMQREHKLACCCHIKYLKLETRIKDVATISYLYCLYIYYLFYSVAPGSHQQSGATFHTNAKPV